MDDPMARSRLGRVTGARPLGLPIPSGGPTFFPARIRRANQNPRVLVLGSSQGINLHNQHLKPPLVMRSMVSGHMRQVPRRPEFNRDVLLGLDGSSVQESGLVTPLANGAHCSRKKRGRAVYELYIQHLTELSDGGADLYGFCRSVSIPRPCIARPNVGDKLTSLQPSGFMSHCRSWLRRNKNRKLRGHRERRRSGNRFFRESQPERLAAFGWGIDKDCGRR